jgi:hypothetical protein
MSWRGTRDVAVGAFAAACMAATPAVAWAKKHAPKAQQDERLQEAETPPPSFIAPPPGYEPPPQFQPGEAGPPVPMSEEPMPAFVTLDRVDASSRAGVQAGWHKIDDVSLSDAFVVRLEPFGQYVLPNRAGGFYGQLPIAHRFDLGADDATGVGNLQLGGFFLPARTSEWILRAGLAAGTASNGAGSTIANFDSRFERLTDYVLIGPHTTSLRLSGSTVRRWDAIFLRADLGLDMVLDKPSAPAGATSVFGRANVAACVRASGVDFTAELVNLVAFNGTAVPSGLTNHLLHTAAVSVRTPGEDQFHFGVVFPLDQEFRGDAWVISLGYQRAGF